MISIVYCGGVGSCNESCPPKLLNGLEDRIIMALAVAVRGKISDFSLYFSLMCITMQILFHAPCT